MRGLEIIVLAIIAVSALAGYYRGFLRVMYSIVSWIIILVFVAFATPHLTDFLENNTRLKTNIQIRCVDYLENMAEEKILQGVEDYNTSAETPIPDSIMEDIAGSAASVFGGILADGGIYKEMADKIAHFIIEGIAFFITMIIVGIFTFAISRMLNLASRIPVIKGPNKLLGAVAGGLKGLVLVWLLFYVISLCAAGGFGEEILQYVEKSPFLSFLYEKNILFLILFQLLKK